MADDYRLTWIGDDGESAAATWGVKPLVVTFSARRALFGGFRGSASAIGCTFWWQGMVGSGQPTSVPTLAEAQAACEAWLEDWLRRSEELRKQWRETR